MKTAISLPDDLFQAADALAQRTGRSRSQLYADALAEYVARHDEDRVTQRLNEVCAEVGGGAPDYLHRAARHLLEDEDW